MKNLEIRVAFSAVDRLTKPTESARRQMGALSESLKKTQTDIRSLDKNTKAFTRLRDSLKSCTDKINAAQKSLDGLRRSEEAGVTITEKQRALMDTLTARIERLSQVRDLERSRLREVSQTMRQHGILLSGSDRAVESAIRRTEQYNNSLEKQRRALAQVTQARERYNRMQSLAGQMRSAGAVAVGAATAGGYGAARLLAPGLSFDREMSRVQSLTRTGKDSPELAALRAQAKQLGAETQFTAGDAASGQSFLAMAGFTPQAIKAAMPGLLDLAMAGGMDLGEASDIGSNILTQFGLSADQMGRVGDVLSATFTRSNTDLRSLGETMKYAGPVAADLGISLEKMSAMAGVLGDNGLRGSMGGTALRAALSRLSSPPKAAARALSELGVQVADVTGKMRQPEEVLKDLNHALSRYGQVDQLSFLKDIAGEEAFVGLSALLKAERSGRLYNLMDASDQSQGEAKIQARVMTDNLDGDLKSLGSAWEGMRIQLSELLDGVLRPVVQGITGVVRQMTAWAEANPGLTRTLMVLVGAGLSLAAVAGTLSLSGALLLGPLSKLQLGFSLLSTGGIAPVVRGIAGLALRLTGLPALWGLVSGAVSLVGGALGALFSPVGLIVVSFVAAAVLIRKYWAQISAFFSGYFAAIIEALTPVREAFSAFSPVFSLIVAGISAVWDWFTRLLSPVRSSQASLDKCTQAGKRFGEVVGAALRMLLSPLEMLMRGVGWLLEKLNLLPDGMNEAVSAAEALSKEPVVWEWDPEQKKMVRKAWQWSPAAPAAGVTEPLSDEHTGVLRRLDMISGNTGGLLDETRKRVGPGDIVFKDLPRALTVRGQWQESRVVRADTPSRVQPGAAFLVNASSPRVVEATRQPLNTGQRTASVAAAPAGFSGEIHVHLHNVVSADPQAMARMVGEAVKAEMNRVSRAGNGSFRDRD